MVYIDESHIDMSSLDKRRWAPVGKKAFIRSRFVQTTRYSVIMAISEALGVSHVEIIQGNVDSDIFLHFLLNMHERLYPVTLTQHRNTSIILDNVSFHHSPNIKSFFQNFNYNAIYLPPYSCELNPCEYVFGFLKNRIRIPINSSSRENIIEMF
jgi:hypothetical protein